jgi:hypothetical protein
VQVEARDEVRYIQLSDGRKFQPDPSIKLQGCQREKLLECFGNDMTLGLSGAPVSQREMREKRTLTDGVEMSISNRANEGADVIFFLGDFDAFQLRLHLFGW